MEALQRGDGILDVGRRHTPGIGFCYRRKRKEWRMIPTCSDLGRARSAFLPLKHRSDCPFKWGIFQSPGIPLALENRVLTRCYFPSWHVTMSLFYPLPPRPALNPRGLRWLRKRLPRFGVGNVGKHESLNPIFLSTGSLHHHTCVRRRVHLKLM